MLGERHRARLRLATGYAAEMTSSTVLVPIAERRATALLRERGLDPKADLPSDPIPF